MGKPTGFLEHQRQDADKETPKERVKHWHEFELSMPDGMFETQGARCMDCGIPFCNTGCPLGNLIPDWNDAVYSHRWADALVALHATNNFPEFTGRVCPAPCEAACVLNINDEPVTIKTIEKRIADRAWEEGLIGPVAAPSRTGKRVAVVGSGPAGLACAQQLARAGHDVTVFERDDRPGGLLVYGIPDFKLDKALVRRRVEQMEAEGVHFETGIDVGRDLPAAELRESFDAVALCGGSRVPRDLPVPGRDLDGIHFAVDFLKQQNCRVAGRAVEDDAAILATGKNVVVIGGGDTGSDCVGTSHRQHAKTVTSFEILPRPPDSPAAQTPWPLWPLVLRTSSSHEEGGRRDFSVSAERFAGRDGHVEKIHCARVELREGKLVRQPGTEFEVTADLVLLAMGFVHPERNGLLTELGVRLTSRGNVRVDGSFMTSTPGVFAAGDMQRGQSLVVWAIADGRRAARGIDEYLMGTSELKVPGPSGRFT